MEDPLKKLKELMKSELVRTKLERILYELHAINILTDKKYFQETEALGFIATCIGADYAIKILEDNKSAGESDRNMDIVSKSILLKARKLYEEEFKNFEDEVDLYIKEDKKTEK